MDLLSASIKSYWEGHADRSLSAFLERMKSLEDWSMEEETPIADLLVALGEDLEMPQARERLLSQDPESVIELLSWLGSPTAFALLEQLDKGEHNALPALLEVAAEKKENPVLRLFIDRLAVLSKTRLITSVFAPQRMMLVEAAVHKVEAEKEAEIYA